ncbi:MAG: hypothetical protein KAJ18_08645 [Candidatus Omnitrophica bacterium]|nr:hypothetical protein [Candidatus Omnitrophota bacterium]
MLNREDILSKNELKKEKVQVPEWGGYVYVSEMSAETRDQWEQELIASRESEDKLVSGRASLAVITIVDEKGNLIFTNEDIPRVAKLSAISLDKITEISQKLNGLSVKVEDVAKNSKADPGGDSISA